MAFTDLDVWASTELEFWTGSLCSVSTVNGPTGRTPVFCFNDEWANRANTRCTAMNVPMPLQVSCSFFLLKKSLQVSVSTFNQRSCRCFFKKKLQSADCCNIQLVDFSYGLYFLRPLQCVFHSAHGAPFLSFFPLTIVREPEHCLKPRLAWRGNKNFPALLRARVLLHSVLI